MILVNKYGSFPNLPFWKVNKGYEDDQTMNFPNVMTQIADFIIMSKQGKYFISLSKNGKIKDIIQVIFNTKTGIQSLDGMVW